MARINLLPWRAERRKQRQRDFYSMIGIAALSGVLLTGLVWFYYDRQVSGQGERNAYLQTEINKVKEQNKEIEELELKRSRLLSRKQVIEELQAKRSQMVHLFDSLVRTIPDGVVLTNVKQVGSTLTLEGRTQSNARVSDYMRKLETSGWMSNPQLSVIEARVPDKSTTSTTVADISSLPYVFSLTVRLPDVEQSNASGLDADGNVVADPADAAAADPDAADPAVPAGEAAPAGAAPAQAPAPAGAPASSPATAPANGAAPANGTAPAQPATDNIPTTSKGNAS